MYNSCSLYMCQYKQCLKLSKRFDFPFSIGRRKILTQQKQLNTPIDTCKVQLRATNLNCKTKQPYNSRITISLS